MTVNPKLREFAALIRKTSDLPKLDRYATLMKFVTGRDKASAWCSRLSADDEGLWTEARVLVAVRLNPERGGNTSLVSEWERLEALVPELAGETPNLQAKRWRDGVERRVLTALGPAPWTKAKAREVCKGMREPDDAGERHANEHFEFYCDLADRMEGQGIGD